MLVAGDLYEQSKAPERALDVYTRFVDEFPKPVETALETRSKIAEIHKAANNLPLYRKELESIVRIDAKAGPERTGRTRTLAGRSALVLAEQDYQKFSGVKLTQPFETSLKEKKERMDAAVAAMDSLVDYEIADVTSAATFYLAEIYYDFSRALAESERPTDLKPEEMTQYEQALDEQAFPFEEKAIATHKKNLELLQKGVFNPWIEKSLGQLATLMPGRYAKPEMSSGFLDTIDTYVYRRPVPPPAAVVPGGAAAPVGDGATRPAASAPTTQPPPAQPPPASGDPGGRSTP
jgi:tetratricopeptide (TPR) repeat protein